jgi:hypothetical protein
VVTIVPSGDLGWVEDETPGPEELAELREDAERAWKRFRLGDGDEPPARMTTGLTPTWTAEVTLYDGHGPCPNCGPGPRRPGVACLVCSATKRNPKRWPMREGPTTGVVRVRRERVKAGLRGGRG